MNDIECFKICFNNEWQIFQAKIHELKSKIKLEKILEDLKYYEEEANGIKDKINFTSDIWIEYDKKNIKVIKYLKL